MSNVETTNQLPLGGFVKILAIAIFLILGIWIGVRFFLPDFPTVFAGNQPDNIGINQEEKLAPCPNSPNCVNSQSEDDDHYINPLTVDSLDSWAKLKEIIAAQPRAEIIAETDNYIYAQFTSRWMGFIDDVEFLVSPTKPNTIEVRSASRLGESDLGVNRQRIETIRQLLVS